VSKIQRIKIEKVAEERRS
jgi:hypothetical protein